MDVPDPARRSPFFVAEIGSEAFPRSSWRHRGHRLHTDAPSQYNKPGGYISNFADDPTKIASDAPIVAGWKKDNPGKALGSFGPPAYGAVQVMLSAIKSN